MDTTQRSSVPGAIVVGVDDTEGSRTALRFAVAEALVRDAALEAVSGWIWQSPYEGFAGPTGVEDTAQDTARMQDRVLEEVTAGLDRVPEIHRTVANGAPGKVLVERAADAAMLVVGSGRKGPLSRAVIGSVSEYCVRHSPVPVVVVPPAAS